MNDTQKRMVIISALNFFVDNCLGGDLTKELLNELNAEQEFILKAS